MSSPAPYSNFRVEVIRNIAIQKEWGQICLVPQGVTVPHKNNLSILPEPNLRSLFASRVNIESKPLAISSDLENVNSLVMDGTPETSALNEQIATNATNCENNSHDVSSDINDHFANKNTFMEEGLFQKSIDSNIESQEYTEHNSAHQNKTNHLEEVMNKDGNFRSTSDKSSNKYTIKLRKRNKEGSKVRNDEKIFHDGNNEMESGKQEVYADFDDDEFDESYGDNTNQDENESDDEDSNCQTRDIICKFAYQNDKGVVENIVKTKKHWKIASKTHLNKIRNPQSYFELKNRVIDEKKNLILRDFQLAGVNWIRKHFFLQQNCLLADEMGLGKTIQASCFLRCIQSECKINGPFLIVCPTSTIGNWEKELQTWTKFSVVKVYGNKQMVHNSMEDARIKQLAKQNMTWTPVNVILTTYELLRKYPILAKVHYKYVIADEAHRLKNPNAKGTEIFRNIKCDGLLLMTGTPIQNDITEFRNLLSFLMPDKAKELEKYDNVEKIDHTLIQEINDIARPYILRRNKLEVLELPIKKETVIEVELTTIQKTFYKAIYQKNKEVLFQKLNRNIGLGKIISCLRKCCNHVYLISGAEDGLVKPDSTQEEINNMLITSSSKLIILDKLMKKFEQEKEKTLIFSQMIDMLDILEDFLTIQNVKYLRIDGGTAAICRQSLIDKFNSDDCYRVFLLSTKAGGVGINLTSANNVILFDSDYNPFNDIQAISRSHRIGQTRDVNVYRLVTATIEKYILSIAAKKLSIEMLLMNSESQIKLDEKEMEEILRNGYYHQLDKKESEKNDNFLINQEIDSILEKAQTISFDFDNTKRSAELFSKIVVNTGQDNASLEDSDFWIKIFPEYVDMEEMIHRINTAKSFGNEEERTNFFKKIESIVNAMTNLSENTTPSADSTPDLAVTADSFHSALERRAKLYNLLNTFQNTAKDLGYSNAVLKKVSIWLDNLEKRSLRARKRGDKAPINITSTPSSKQVHVDEDDEDEEYIDEASPEELSQELEHSGLVEPERKKNRQKKDSQKEEANKRKHSELLTDQKSITNVQSESLSKTGRSDKSSLHQEKRAIEKPPTLSSTLNHSSSQVPEKQPNNLGMSSLDKISHSKSDLQSRTEQKQQPNITERKSYDEINKMLFPLPESQSMIQEGDQKQSSLMITSISSAGAARINSGNERKNLEEQGTNIRFSEKTSKSLLNVAKVLFRTQNPTTLVSYILENNSLR